MIGPDPVAPVTEGAYQLDRSWQGASLAIGTSVCFASSSIFIRYGLAGLPSPLLGVTVGLAFVAAAYGLAHWARRGRQAWPRLPGRVLALQILAGTLVGLATWARWAALDTVELGVVIALSRLSVPVVLILSPILISRAAEQVTARVWLGALMILAGAMILTFY